MTSSQILSLLSVDSLDSHHHDATLGSITNIHSSLRLSLLRCPPRFYLYYPQFLQIPIIMMPSQILSLLSIVPLDSYHCNVILVSNSITCSSFGFSSSQHHLRFYFCYLQFLQIPIIMMSSYLLSLLFVLLFYSHHCDAILGLISITYSFFRFPSSQRCPRFYHCYLQFLWILIIIMPSQVISLFISSSFGFPSL